MSEELVVPGEILAVIEEYYPGEYIYEKDGFLRASVVGKVNADRLNHVISVLPSKGILIPRVKDAVYAQVASVRNLFAVVRIYEVENKGFLPIPFTGIIHVSYALSEPVRDMHNLLRIGDIIRAKVISDEGPPFHLTLRGREFGVILSWCPFCVKPLRKRGLFLFCPVCRMSFRKKISSMYLQR